MKITSRNLLVQLNRNELSKLTKEVSETIYLDTIATSNSKPLTSAELGRIQRMKKAVVVGRRYL